MLYKSYRLQNPIHSNALMLLENHMSLAQKAKSTRQSYLYAIHKIIKNFNCLPEHCDRNDLINYFVGLVNNFDYKYSTIKIYIVALSYYLSNIAGNVELIKKIPFPNIKRLDIQILTIQEVHQVFNACQSKRELLFFQMLYETGMRIGEIANLNIADINFDFRYLTIQRSKNRKTRTVKFGETLERTLKSYLEESPSLFTGTHLEAQYHPIFPIQSRTMQKTVRTVCKRANIERRITAHSFRHAFAVHFLNFGGSILRLKNALGHARLKSTLYYLEYASFPDDQRISPLDSIVNI